MKRTLFLLFAAAFFLTSLSSGQVLSETSYFIGFKPEDRVAAPGTVITVPLFVKAGEFMGMDATISIDSALMVRNRFSFDWRLLPNSFKVNHFNEQKHELKIAVAGSRRMSIPELSKLGSFRVKVPEVQSPLFIRVSSAGFDGGAHNTSVNGLRIGLGPRVTLGDADLNGRINSMDAVFCLVIAAQPDSAKYSLNDRQFLSADVDGDFEITEVDGLNILQKSVDSEFCFPAEDCRPTISGGGSGGSVGSAGVMMKPVAGGCAVVLNSSEPVTSGRFEMKLPAGVVFEPGTLSRVLYRSSESGGTLMVAFAGSVPNGPLFTLKGANTSGAEISGRLNGNNIDVKKTEAVTGVEDVSLPAEFFLSQNYPNPFNPTTRISYRVARNSHVTLSVHDMLGREVAVLVNGEKPAGSHNVQFNASGLPSGTYVYRLRAEGFVETKRMIFLK
jgi:hypothetical protein